MHGIKKFLKPFSLNCFSSKLSFFQLTMDIMSKNINAYNDKDTEV